ncbi:MAG: LysM peptidoglycan-binding domain-containing protein [Acidimicrobiales bacterium]
MDPGWRAPTCVRPRPLATTLMRRRILALALLALIVAGLALGARAAWGVLGGGPLTAPGSTPRPATVRAVHVVQPGETLWSIARAMHPDGDVRAVVDRLTARNGGAELRVGQHLTLS